MSVAGTASFLENAFLLDKGTRKKYNGCNFLKKSNQVIFAYVANELINEVCINKMTGSTCMVKELFDIIHT